MNTFNLTGARHRFPFMHFSSRFLIKGVLLLSKPTINLSSSFFESCMSAPIQTFKAKI